MLFEDVVAIKQNNLKKLLTTIRFNDCLTRRDIANKTNLSPATITNLCNELISKKVVAEGDLSSQTRVGRTPNVIKFLYNNFYSIAIDFQYENIIGIAILNMRNEICFSDSLYIPPGIPVLDIIALVKTRLDVEITQLGISDRIIGVGASVPAVYDRNDGLIKFSAISRYQNIPLKKMLADAFKYPSYVGNCASLRALSAYAQHESPIVVCLDVSQGVGCGVVIHGEVLLGKNGYATEIAHFPLGDVNKTCSGCGSKGCIETDLNVNSIISHFSLFDDKLSLPAKWKQCIELLKKDSTQMDSVLRHIGTQLGQIASVLINMFDPYDFYVTGFITDIFPWIKDSFWKEIHNRSSESLDRKLRIKIMEYKWSDVYIGISDTMYHRWLP